MGEVYRAYDRRLERRVAIKHIHPDRESNDNARRRLRREAKATAALAHPAIVQVFDILEDDDGEWIVMELIEGPSLAHRLESGPLQVDAALDVARTVVEGLAYAHAQGFIHRDLKTENVILSPLGQAKILDFGLAKRLGRDEESLTRDGSVVGTSRAMSPEQAQGYKVDARSDLFSLGVLIYECLTGRSPFKADSAVATLTRVCTHRQKPVRELNPQVPKDLARLIDRLLEKLPEMRPDSARRVAKKLTAISRRLERTTSIACGKPIAESETIDFVATGDLPPDRLEPEAKDKNRSSRTASLQTLARATPVAFLLTLVLPTVFLPELRQKLLDWLMNRSDPIASPPEVSPPSGTKADPLRIVVLPFDSLGSQEDAYFAAGISEEISRRLTALSGLGVISRTSASRYADAALNVQQIGAALDVAYVLEGTVNWPPVSTSDNPLVRVTPRLIRVADDLQIWTEAYEQQLDDFLGLQAEIAAAVASQLDLSLQQTERRALAARGTEVPAAYFAYLRGLDYMNQPQFSGQGLKIAASMFERAVEEDPTFVEAYAALCRTESLIYFNRDQSEARRQKAEAALRSAHALDADSIEVRVATAFYQLEVEEDYEKAALSFSTAAQLAPHDAEILAGLGFARQHQGEFDQAIVLLKDSYSLDQANAQRARALGETYQALRRYEDAAHWYELALQLAPDYAFALGNRALSILASEGCPTPASTPAECSTGPANKVLADSPISEAPRIYRYQLLLDLYTATLAEPQQALALYEMMARRISRMPGRPDGPGDGCRYFWREAVVFERLGRMSQARELVEACREELERIVASRDKPLFERARLGIALAYLGNRDQALATGEQAMELAAQNHFTGPWIREHIAIILMLLGDRQAALDHLESLIQTPYKNSINRTMLHLDPIWDPLRDLPRFKDLLEG